MGRPHALRCTVACRMGLSQWPLGLRAHSVGAATVSFLKSYSHSSADPSYTKYEPKLPAAAMMNTSVVQIQNGPYLRVYRSRYLPRYLPRAVCGRTGPA